MFLRLFAPSSPSAEAIANAFLLRGNKEGILLPAIQLHRLIYMTHGWCLACLNYGLLKERPLAWPRGPAYLSIARKTMHYEGGFVTDLFRSDKIILNGQIMTAILYSDEERIVDIIWDFFKKLSEYDLVRLTRGIDTPWAMTEKMKNIPNDMIKAYFLDLKK